MHTSRAGISHTTLKNPGRYSHARGDVWNVEEHGTCLGIVYEHGVAEARLLSNR